MILCLKRRGGFEFTGLKTFNSYRLETINYLQNINRNFYIANSFILINNQHLRFRYLQPGIYNPFIIIWRSSLCGSILWMVGCEQRSLFCETDEILISVLEKERKTKDVVTSLWQKNLGKKRWRFVYLQICFSLFYSMVVIKNQNENVRNVLGTKETCLLFTSNSPGREPPFFYNREIIRDTKKRDDY